MPGCEPGIMVSRWGIHGVAAWPVFSIQLPTAEEPKAPLNAKSSSPSLSMSEVTTIIAL